MKLVEVDRCRLAVWAPEHTNFAKWPNRMWPYTHSYTHCVHLYISMRNDEGLIITNMQTHGVPFGFSHISSLIWNCVCCAIFSFFSFFHFFSMHDFSQDVRTRARAGAHTLCSTPNTALVFSAGIYFVHVRLICLNAFDMSTKRKARIFWPQIWKRMKHKTSSNYASRNYAIKTVWNLLFMTFNRGKHTSKSKTFALITLE